jgi:hypothetical protein
MSICYATDLQKEQGMIFNSATHILSSKHRICRSNREVECRCFQSILYWEQSNLSPTIRYSAHVRNRTANVNTALRLWYRTIRIDRGVMSP